MKKEYTTRAGVKQYKPALKSLERIINSGNCEGYCLACGDKAYGVEPDAAKYTCESCDKPKVYGAEQLILMGLYH